MNIWAWLFGKEKEYDPMKFLAVGLGNIGSEYEGTRHNVGFDVVDKLATDKEVNWKVDKLGSVATIKHKGRTIILLKPSTYMNRSGKAVQYWMQKEKIPIDKTIIIVDDLNIDFGKIRIRGKGSDGGHNGLKDLNQVIGNKYARIRVGIGDDFKRGQQVDYVLGKWDTDEKGKLPELLKQGADAVLSFAAIGLAHTMNQYSKK